MRSSRLLVAICAFGLFLQPYLAKGDTCASTTLNNILGSTCTIGDKTFDFTGFNSFSGINSSALEFTPDASNPLSPAFVLSSVTGGPITVSATGNGNNMIQVLVNYTVSVTDGSARLIGGGVTLNGPSVTLSGQTGDNGISDADNELGSLVGGATEVFIQCMVPAGPSGCSTSTSAAQLTTGGTFAPVSSATGQIGLEVLAQTGGGSVSASLTSAEYSFTESPLIAAPEPSSLLLLGSGLMSVVGLRRRLIRNH